MIENWLPPGCLGSSLEIRVRNTMFWEGLWIKQLNLHIKGSQFNWFKHLTRMLHGCLPCEGRLSWRDCVSQRFDSSSSQGEGGVSDVHQSRPPAPEWVMLWVVGCIMKTSLHCGSTFTFLHLPGVFVLSDFAGVGAWGGTRCDSGEGVELWHNLPGENLLLFSELNFFLVVVVRTVWSLAEFKNEEKLCRIFPCHPALCP